MIEYGEIGPPRGFEEDPLIDLGIGGAPQDPHNCSHGLEPDLTQAHFP
jgi:hypothetical protein